MAPPAGGLKSMQLSSIRLRLVVSIHPITIEHIPRLVYFKAFEAQFFFLFL